METQKEEPQISVGSAWVSANGAFAKELGIELHDFPADAAKKARLRVDYSWLETEIDPHWIAAFRLLPQNGILQIAELRIFPAENYRNRPPGEWSAALHGNKTPFPKGGLKMTILQKVRTGEVTRRMTSHLLEFRNRGASHVLESSKLAMTLLAEEKPKTKNEKRGRPSLPDIEYAKVAHHYCQRCEKGSRKPSAETADHFGNTPAKTRSQLHEARKRGLLTSGRPGFAFGELTDLAKSILAKSPKRKGSH